MLHGLVSCFPFGDCQAVSPCFAPLQACPLSATSAHKRRGVATNCCLAYSNRVFADSAKCHCRRGASPWVCVHKCLAVADAVLGPRSRATAQAFAATLLKHAERASSQEVDKYHATPPSLTPRCGTHSFTHVPPW